MGGKRKLTMEEFIERSNILHGNFYNYDKVNYINYSTHVIVICPIHGEFKITPNKHLNGQGCPKCRYIKSSISNRRSIDEVVDESRKVHGEKYDYSLIKEYKNDREKLPIICKTHGIFYQTMNRHIKLKQGCPVCGRIKCSESRKLTTEKFIEKACKVHGNKYDYSKVNLDKLDEDGKITIICKKHGEFTQKFSNHLFGQGCPKCKESKLEILVENLLKSNKILFERQKTFEWLKYKRNLYLDFYLPQYNIAIECQGKQHFGIGNWKNDSDKLVIRDKLKYELCKENNIKILYFSNLKINYPYEVIEDDKVLLEKIYECDYELLTNPKQILDKIMK